MNKAALEKKIAELVKYRDEVVVQANNQIAFINGQIEALTQLAADLTADLTVEDEASVIVGAE